MQLRRIAGDFSICRVRDLSQVKWQEDWTFAAIRPGELSLLCKSAHVPPDALKREDGYCGFEIVGQLDFSLIGILARISTVLAEAGVSILAQSTFDTDCVFLKTAQRQVAAQALVDAGYTFVEEGEDDAL